MFSFSSFIQWGTNGAVGRRNVFDELPVALKAELSLSINNHVLDKVCNKHLKPNVNFIIC